MRSWFKARADITGWDILLRLTLMEILLRPAGPWTIRPFILLFACAGIIFSSLLRSPLLWLILFLLISARIVIDWPMPDNHIYLLAYWCLLLFLAIQSTLPEFTLKQGSRLLIAFAFLLAVLWKGVLSPDYLDGRFFRVTFLTDERFAATSMLIGGLSKEQLKENREYLIPLPEGAELLDPPRLAEPPRLNAFVSAATWGALLLESLVAIVFLIPGRLAFRRAGLRASGSSEALSIAFGGQGRPPHGSDGLSRWRQIVLLVFCLVTYPFAPVAGFGWLLLVMGLAQCNPNQRMMKALYVISYFLVLLFAEIPWAGAILEWKNF